MFGKKAKEIKRLKAVAEEFGKALTMQAEAAKQHDSGLYAEIAALRTANADKDTKLANAQALIQRAEADRDAQKKRADENYASYQAADERAVRWNEKYLAEKKRADSLVVPFTAAVQAEASPLATGGVVSKEVLATVVQGTYLPERAFPTKKPRATKPKKG